METAKQCFVIMPFGAIGSESYQKNRRVLDELIRPLVSSRGYKVTRGDEIATAGSITRDIIEWLHEADLVIADLTGQNANVFYELGVRHALRNFGTIPIIEVGSSIPFDLSAYRILHYDFTGSSIRQFADELSRLIDTFENFPRNDSPVHDVLANKITSVIPPLDSIGIGRVEAGATETVWAVLLANDFYHLSLDQFKPATIANIRKGVHYRFVIPDTPQCKRAIGQHAEQCVIRAGVGTAPIGGCEYRLLHEQQMGMLVPSVFFDVYKGCGSGYIRSYQRGKHLWFPFDHDRLWQAVEGFEYLWEQASPSG